MSNAKFGGKFQKLKSLKSAFSDSDCLIQMRERVQLGRGRSFKNRSFEFLSKTG
jgi:hypothetical protein